MCKSGENESDMHVLNRCSMLLTVNIMLIALGKVSWYLRSWQQIDKQMHSEEEDKKRRAALLCKQHAFTATNPVP